MARKGYGLWFGVSCDADASPQLAMLRAETDDTGDLYYYRALGWCKRFCRTGNLADWWQALSTSIRWPGQWSELRDIWRKCHVVEGSLDSLFDWARLNSWLVGRQDKAKNHMAEKRAAGVASGKSRRETAQQLRLLLAQLRPPKMRQQVLPKTRAVFRKQARTNKSAPEKDRRGRIG